MTAAISWTGTSNRKVTWSGVSVDTVPPVTISQTTAYLSGNTYIVIKGSGFSRMAIGAVPGPAVFGSVMFGSTAAQWAFVYSDTELHTMMFPAASAQAVSLTITRAGLSTITIPFAFLSRTISAAPGVQQNFLTATGDDHWQDICLGNDDNLWMASGPSILGGIGSAWKITNTGIGTQFVTNPYGLFRICAGPGGNLWASSNAGLLLPYILKITPLGVSTPFALPFSGSQFEVAAVGVCTGPDSALYVVGYVQATISGSLVGIAWRITDAGEVTTFPVTGAGYLNGVCCGQNNDLWATELQQFSLVRISTAGVILGTYVLPCPSGCAATGVCFGSDGYLYVACYGRGSKQSGIARVNPANPTSSTYLPVGTPATVQSINRVNPGPDGNIWFTYSDNNAIGGIAQLVIGTGAVNFYPVANSTAPLNDVLPSSTCAASDGSMWLSVYSDEDTSFVTRIT